MERPSKNGIALRLDEWRDMIEIAKSMVSRVREPATKVHHTKQMRGELHVAAAIRSNSSSIGVERQTVE